MSNPTTVAENTAAIVAATEAEITAEQPAPAQEVAEDVPAAVTEEVTPTVSVEPVTTSGEVVVLGPDWVTQEGVVNPDAIEGETNKQKATEGVALVVAFYQAELIRIAIDRALEKEQLRAKVETVMMLLDKTNIVVNGTEVTGAEEAIADLKTKEPALFEDSYTAAWPQNQGFEPNPNTTPAPDMSKMSNAEIVAYGLSQV